MSEQDLTDEEMLISAVMAVDIGSCLNSKKIEDAAEAFYHKYQCTNGDAPLVRKWLDSIHKSERKILQIKFSRLYQSIQAEKDKCQGHNGAALALLLCVNAMKAIILLELTSSGNQHVFKDIVTHYEQMRYDSDNKQAAIDYFHETLAKLTDVEPEITDVKNHLLKDVEVGINYIFDFYAEHKINPIEADCDKTKELGGHIRNFVIEYEDETHHSERVNKWMEEVKTERDHLMADFGKVHKQITELTGKFAGKNESYLMFNLCVRGLRAISGLELCSDENLREIDDMLDQIDMLDDCKMDELDQKIKLIETHINALSNMGKELAHVISIFRKDLAKTIKNYYQEINATNDADMS